jgi:ATP-binding cassette subfamily C protein
MTWEPAFLIDDTARRNIAFALDDDEIDEMRVRDSISLSGLADVVARLPKGLDTRVGEQGVPFSAGEWQHMGIARALYRDSEFIVLDEPTSALDHWTERLLIGSLERLRGSTTILIASHRDSLIHTCDRLLWLRQGHPTAYNSYADLLASGYDLAASQLRA